MKTKECRICREDEDTDRPLLNPCLCSGSMKYCHQECLDKWQDFSGRWGRCEICGENYNYKQKVNMMELIKLVMRILFQSMTLLLDCIRMLGYFLILLSVITKLPDYGDIIFKIAECWKAPTR